MRLHTAAFDAATGRLFRCLRGAIEASTKRSGTACIPTFRCLRGAIEAAWAAGGWLDLLAFRCLRGAIEALLDDEVLEGVEVLSMPQRCD